MVLQKAFDTYRDHLCLNHMTYAEVADHVAAIRQNMINEKLYPGSKLFIYADGNKEAALLVILAALRYKYIPVIQSSRLSASLSFANNSIVNTDTLPYGYETTDLLIGTSGTSGSPKLVAHSGQALLSNIEGIRSYLSLQEGENILIIRSVANLSVWTNELLLGLFAGCHIHTFEGNLSPSAVTKALTTLNIHYLVSVPTFVHFMLPYFRRYQAQLNSLRYLKCVGEVAHMDTLREVQSLLPNTEIFNCYGLTETGPRLTWWSSKHDPPEDYTVGKPIPGVSIKIVSETNNVLSAYEKGIVQIATHSLMLGYWGSAPTESGYYSTKDWGWLDDKGSLFIEGRYDELIVRGGVKIAPAVIERMLLEHPDIHEVLVEHEAQGRYNVIIRALVVLMHHCSTTSLELLQWSQQRLPKEYQIQEVQIVESIAKLPNGKKQRTIRGDASGFHPCKN